MGAWVDELAEALGVEPLSGGETGRLLSTAREIAHRVERKDTPLATFLLGMAAGRRLGEGTSREDAFRESIDVVLARLPEEPPPAG
jgi:uncharacterized protein DUF6457